MNEWGPACVSACVPIREAINRHWWKFWSIPLMVKIKLSDNFPTVGLGLTDIIKCFGHLLPDKFNSLPFVSTYPTLSVLAFPLENMVFRVSCGGTRDTHAEEWQDWVTSMLLSKETH